MLKLQGYTITATIAESIKSIIYAGKNDVRQDLVIIKTLTDEQPFIEDLTKLKLEYNLLKSIDIDGIAKPSDYINFKQSGAIDKNVKPVDLTSATAFKEIKDALMFATTVTNPNAENVGQVSATRMRYRADLVNGGYFDFQNGKLVRADYINDVLRKAHAEIFTTPQTQEVFNAYMQFALPGGITEEIDEAKNEIESENFRS